MKYALYRAMNKYGIDNFMIEEIEKCEIDKLNEREIYWINYYDSYNNGYNLTLGGGGTKFHNLDENEVINKFKELDNVTEVAKIYGCSSNVISEILDKHNIHIKNSKERGLSVDRCSLNGDFLEHYESLHEAAVWLKENIESLKDKNSINISYSLKNHICREESFHNFIWKSGDISDNSKLERLNKLKENEATKRIICPICNKNFKRKESNSCQECFNKSFETDIIIQKKFIDKKIIKKSNKCKICGLFINNRSVYCKKCFSEENKKIRNDIFVEKLENIISKKELMQLVRIKSFNEIGRIYDVEGNTVKRWCKKYCIPFRKEDIVEISNEDWEVECNLSKEEYEAKYINTKKEKPIITDQDIIDKYLELKNLSALEKLFHKDAKTIKKNLLKNGIDLSDTAKKNVLKVQKLDSDSLDILEEFSYL